MHNQTKYSVRNIMIKLDDFRNNDKKKNLRGHFWQLSDELLNKILPVYVFFVYIFCSKILFYLIF